MKRFYKQVGTAQCEAGWHVTLDDRPIKTQAGAPQIVPSQACAQLLAEEWRAQGEKIDLKAFIFRDLADFAIDKVAPDPSAAIAKLLSFAQTDTLCYRAGPDDLIFARQQELWEPLVTACEARHKASFHRISGIMHHQQPDATIAALRKRLEGECAFTLAAMVTLASLAASLIVPLTMLEEGEDAKALFAASNAEEDWQAELWGADFEAEQVRAARLEAFEKADLFLRSLR